MEGSTNQRGGRPKGYDRRAVLVVARDLFWEKGYEATSISDLERHTGLNRSSLYQEFGSKRDLFTRRSSATPTRSLRRCSPTCARRAHVSRPW